VLKPIISHQKEIKEILKKMQFLRDGFEFGNIDVFLEELSNLAVKMKSELEYHFNLQIYSITNEKAKKFVLENMLVRDMLFRMLDNLITRCNEKNVDAFLKFEEFEAILDAYLKKEKALFISQLKSVLNEKEIEEIENNLKKLL